MATSRPGSRRRAGAGARPGRRSALLGLGVAAGLAAAAPGLAHPSAEEHEAAARSRALCTAPGGETPDPVRLGEREAALRERFDGALEEQPLGSARADPPLLETAGAAEARGYEGQRRLVRTLAEGDVREIAYALYEGRVYRIRWRLAPRFEAPIADVLAERARLCLGPPDYDQRVEPKLASGRDVVRRLGWRGSDRLLELRQLHPATGGPVYLAVTDLAAQRRLVEAGGTAAPEPESTGSWWRRAPKELRVLPEEERASLARAFARLLAHAER